MKRRIGAITIGQSPRDDIIDDICPLLPESLEIIQKGVLDGMTSQELEAIAPSGTSDADFGIEIIQWEKCCDGRKKDSSYYPKPYLFLRKRGCLFNINAMHWYVSKYIKIKSTNSISTESSL